MNINVSEEDSKYMYDFVRRIIDEIGPRMSCSSQEAEAAEFIKNELEKSCDEVSMEEFTCHPKAFLGWIKLDMFMIVISILLYFISQIFTDQFWLLVIAIISFLFILSPFLIMWEEFFNYREFIDPLFRKKSSQNVISKFKSEGELNRIIIFSSHMDTAIEFKLMKLLGWKFILIAFGVIFLMLMWLVLSFLHLTLILIGFISLKAIFLNIMIWALIIGSPFIILLYFFVPLGDKGNVVPGAADNLSSCSVIQGMGRYLKKNRDIIPPNTEIRLISFGCEEVGLRGSYRYVEAHHKELKKCDTLVVNMDGLEKPDHIYIIEFEPTTRTWHSEDVIQKLSRAAEIVNIEAKRIGSGRLEKVLGRLTGGSDAAAFSKAGIKAGFINAADWKNRSSYYHQSGDTLDKIEKGTLEAVLKIIIAFLINESKLKS
ncbi:MAG: M28 family peptidase [Candidatus Lokiarchaeota archaeon]|nr:M28 family peptidase [Candidatus Lokiarchaeota archaeon]